MKAVADHHHYHGSHYPSPTPATKISIPFSAGGGGEAAALLGKGRYRVWAVAAIALRWSSGDLAATLRDVTYPLVDDLDPLEMEEREKLVRRMWDVYTRTGDHLRLPKFWQEAFEAAYEELAGDDMPARTQPYLRLLACQFTGLSLSSYGIICRNNTRQTFAEVGVEGK